MFIAGGFQRNGKRVRWLPLGENSTLYNKEIKPRLLVGRPGKPMIEELPMLVEPRRWAPSVGSVGDTLVVAGGGNWGTNTVEVFDRSAVFDEKKISVISDQVLLNHLITNYNPSSF